MESVRSFENENEEEEGGMMKKGESKVGFKKKEKMTIWPRRLGLLFGLFWMFS